MNREVEFRGRAPEGRWAYGYLLRFETKGEPSASILESSRDYWAANDTPVDPKTVGEWTGLKNKNGTKIFEGDITEHKGRMWVIIWHVETASFWAELISVDEEKESLRLGHYFEVTTWGEVIGNIHENPHLLTQNHAE